MPSLNGVLHDINSRKEGLYNGGKNHTQKWYHNPGKPLTLRRATISDSYTVLYTGVSPGSSFGKEAGSAAGAEAAEGTVAVAPDWLFGMMAEGGGWTAVAPQSVVGTTSSLTLA